MEWTRAGLADRGFSGFVPFTQLTAADVPTGPGVYVVVLADGVEPTWRETSPAGWHKRRNPSVTVAALREAWVPGTTVLYIGKADAGGKGLRGLRVRLDEYRRHGSGKLAGHWGGRYVWQLAEPGDLLVGWMLTPGRDPEDVESELLRAFMKDHGQRQPFANLRSPGPTT